jgi:hypothetical protein
MDHNQQIAREIDRLDFGGWGRVCELVTARRMPSFLHGVITPYALHRRVLTPRALNEQIVFGADWGIAAFDFAFRRTERQIWV